MLQNQPKNQKIWSFHHSPDFQKLQKNYQVCLVNCRSSITTGMSYPNKVFLRKPFFAEEGLNIQHVLDLCNSFNTLQSFWKRPCVLISLVFRICNSQKQIAWNLHNRVNRKTEVCKGWFVWEIIFSNSSIVVQIDRMIEKISKLLIGLKIPNHVSQ